MNSIGAKERAASFVAKMNMDYDFKKKYAALRIREFVQECDRRGLNYHVSVGGLDSITLYMYLKKLRIECPAISVSYLEDTSIQKIHHQLGIIRLQSAKRKDGTHWNKANIIQEFGFPVLSKEIASKIEMLQNPSEKNKTVRHAIITGETGEYGGFRIGTRMKMAQKWLELFGGPENENEGVNYKTAPFKVSDKCCYYLKEKPCDEWAKAHNSVPFLGLMASEGGRRQKSLMLNGCNYFGSTAIRSAPFAIFQRQDLLRLAIELDVPVPEIYGEIKEDGCGGLCTTCAQRTGCSMCGFGIHLEKRPHRFDMLLRRNPKEWHYYMYEICQDPDGTKYGWARVLDYIGIGYDKEEDL